MSGFLVGSSAELSLFLWMCAVTLKENKNRRPSGTSSARSDGATIMSNSTLLVFSFALTALLLAPYAVLGQQLPPARSLPPIEGKFDTKNVKRNVNQATGVFSGLVLFSRLLRKAHKIWCAQRCQWHLQNCTWCQWVQSTLLGINRVWILCFQHSEQPMLPHGSKCNWGKKACSLLGLRPPNLYNGKDRLTIQKT